ncbi:MAG: hypothetical protein AAGA86_09090 [Bacteroidota bacterium]
MKNVVKLLVFWAAFSGFLNSCSESQDFNQYDDLEITPSYEASIFYLESTEDVINAAADLSFFAQDFNFDAFSESVFANRVIEGSLTYEVENTTSKPLEIVIEFLDEGNGVLDTETFSIGAAPTALLQREVAYGNAGRSIDILTSTSGLRVRATNLGDTTSTSDLPDPMIKLRSSGEFRVRVK